MLGVFGQVEITLGDGRRGRFEADGSRLVLHVDEASSLVGLAGRRTLRTLAEALARTGLTLYVRTGDRVLLVAGNGVRTSLLGRLLQLPHAHLDRTFALRSAVARARS